MQFTLVEYIYNNGDIEYKMVEDLDYEPTLGTPSFTIAASGSWRPIGNVEISDEVLDARNISIYDIRQNFQLP
jgi:hypothetical protein